MRSVYTEQALRRRYGMVCPGLCAKHGFGHAAGLVAQPNALCR